MMLKLQYFSVMSKKLSVLELILNNFKVKLQRIIKTMIFLNKFTTLFTMLKNQLLLV